jgi:hypothetical protein
MPDNIVVNVTEVATNISVNVVETLNQVSVNIAQIGLPAGGPAGFVLTKNTNLDYDTHWIPMIYYGTGGPPSALGLTDGTQYLKYTP